MVTYGLFNYLKTLEEQESDTRRNKLHLLAQLIRSYLEDNIDRVFDIFHPFFTLHDHTHSDVVVNNLYTILRRVNLVDPTNESSLSYYETFYLIAAAYLHDIGMIIMRPDDAALVDESGGSESLSSIIRRDHHVRSAEWVREYGQVALQLNGPEIDVIAALCEGHRLDSIEGPAYKDISDEKGRVIRVGLLAALLQVADELDMSHSRAPEHERLFLNGLEDFDAVARRHWMKHYYTDNITLKVENEGKGTFQTVKIYIHLSVPDATHKHFLINEISTRLSKHLVPLEPIFHKERFTIEIGDFDVKENETRKSSVLRKKDVHILCVDDEEMWRDRITDALSSEGFTFYNTVTNSKDVLAAVVEAQASETPYHLVTLDLNMENLSGEVSPRAGVDLIEPVRRYSRGVQLILFTSGDLDDAITKEGRRKGVKVISKLQGARQLAKEIKDTILLSYILE